MCKKEVVIVGAGGHSKVIEDIIAASGDSVFGFLDDNETSSDKIKILGKTDDYTKYQDKYFIIAIGNNYIREKISLKLKGVKFYTGIHPSSIISPSAVIKEGSVIMPGCVINASASIGKHCIVNSNATVEHDCMIDDFSHISPGSVICGTVSVSKNTWIGAGSVIKNNIAICAHAIIGAGSVVIKQICEPGIYAGIPAKKIK